MMNKKSMGCISQVKTRLKFAALGAALITLPLVNLSTPAAFSASPPSAAELLALVRANESQQNRDLTGRLRTSTSAGKIIVPFNMLMRPGSITYQFANPPESLTLTMGAKGSRLTRSGGKGGVRLDELVRGTDITYEDLALRFLYWTNAKVVGPDTAMTRKCWVVQAQPPARGESQYDMVRLWIEKTGGLLRAECYANGRLAKRFEVRSVQQARDGGGGYILKSMRIQSIDGSGRDRSPTYLEINRN